MKEEKEHVDTHGRIGDDGLKDWMDVENKHTYIHTYIRALARRRHVDQTSTAYNTRKCDVDEREERSIYVGVIAEEMMDSDGACVRVQVRG